MKKYFFYAAAVALAGCTSNGYLGDEMIGDARSQFISFGGNVGAITRAAQTPAESAISLGNQFFVYGIKNELAYGKEEATDGNTVFDNYRVTYTANSAYTTQSNTKDWEYVGNTDYNGTTVQTIKYWDYNASDYTFYALSAKPEDLTSPAKVSFTKTTSGANDVWQKGYRITTTAGADLSKIYLADRVNITKTTGTNRVAENAYGGTVKFTFRNPFTKIRAAFYETIPGYHVTITKMYGDGTDVSTTNFMASAPNTVIKPGQTFDVEYYQTPGNLAEQAKLSVNGVTEANTLELGTQVFGSNLGVTTTAATFDQAAKAYTFVMPQTENATYLKLKVDYKLTSTDGSGEVINVTGATAEIPAKYIAWKPNFAYTYIFKISNNTNGTTGTGSDPTGLYPITFDAVVVNTEDGTDEYITTVSEPSITTYAKGSDVTTDGEYKVSSDIYAVVMDGSAIVDYSTNSSRYNFYSVTTSDATNFPITEAAVAEALAEPSTVAKKLTVNLVSDALENSTTVPDDDGKNITINAVKIKGAKIAAAGTYVLEYVNTPATYHNDGGKTYADAAAFAAAGTLYSDAECQTVAETFGNASTTYYKRTAVLNVGVYAYKVIVVNDATPARTLK